MTLDKDVTKAIKLHAVVDESAYICPNTVYKLNGAIFHMLRATASRMELSPENSDDVRRAFELYRKVNESAIANPNTLNNLMDACYHLSKAIQERT